MKEMVNKIGINNERYLYLIVYLRNDMNKTIAKYLIYDKIDMTVNEQIKRK